MTWGSPRRHAHMKSITTVPTRNPITRYIILTSMGYDHLRMNSVARSLEGNSTWVNHPWWSKCSLTP